MLVSNTHKNAGILLKLELEQNFTAHMPLMMATYLHHICTVLLINNNNKKKENDNNNNNDNNDNNDNNSALRWKVTRSN